MMRRRRVPKTVCWAATIVVLLILMQLPVATSTADAKSAARLRTTRPATLALQFLQKSTPPFTSSGDLFAFGEAWSFGAPTFASTSPIVGTATSRCGSPCSASDWSIVGAGHWVVTADGNVFTTGWASFLGSMGGRRLRSPMVGMAATRVTTGVWYRGSPLPPGVPSLRSGGGYWLVASDGGIFGFGDAKFYGSMGNKRLTRPVVGMVATPSGRGYWLVASDGGIFGFGDAKFYGSMGGNALDRNVVAIDRAPAGLGYVLVTTGRAGTRNSVPSPPFAVPTAVLKGVFPATGSSRTFAFLFSVTSETTACVQTFYAAVAAGFTISPSVCTRGLYSGPSFRFARGNIHGLVRISTTVVIPPGALAAGSLAVAFVTVD